MAASILSRRLALSFSIFKDNYFQKSLLPLVFKHGSLLQTATYNPKPLKLNTKQPYIPDKDNEDTPKWQKTDKFDRKLYGRYGSVSGVDPANLWPSPRELEELVAEEKEWHPPLEVMLENVTAREMEAAKKQRAREKLIAANMAKMPKMIEDWRRETLALKLKKKEEKARKDRLLAEAKERFGYALDPRSPKFKEMVEEIEKEEKKKRKLLKTRAKQMKSEAMTSAPRTAT